MVGCSDSAAEWLRLLDVCRDLTPLLDGQVRNFVVLPFGAANSQGAVTWVRAHIQTAHSMDAPHTVALKIRTADWLAVRFNQGHLKAVQATFCDEKPYPILDLSGPESVLVASVNIRNAECLQVAEVFCGGFSGWAQGVTLLHSAAMPLQLAWRLDWDPSVNKYLQTQHPALRVISTPAALEEVLPHEDILLQVDAFEVWWLRMQSARQVHIMTISAPCPAWSNAARSRGLHSREGSLLLHMAGVCGCLGIPVVALEQVDHFPKHADYEAVMTAWRSAGYVQVWSSVLDLLDLLPASRRRFLAVLVHKESGLPLLPLAGENWLRCNIPTLARADAIFPLPAQLRSSLTLPQSVLQQYLDPALLPGSVARRHGSAPTQYRVRTPAGTATCFMARYTSQHDLPLELLQTRGLMGCLLNDGARIRFFSSPEVSSLHCMHEALWISPATSCNMQIVGNSITVPHAIAALIMTLHAAVRPPALALADAVYLAVENRLTAANTCFLPVDEGWVLCKQDALQQMLLRSLPAMSFSTTLAGQTTCEVVLVCQETRFEVQVDAYCQPGLLCAHLGLADMQQQPQLGGSVSLTALPVLTSRGCFLGAQPTPCTTILTPTQLFVSSGRTPLACLLVLEACQSECDAEATCSLFGIEGARCVDLLCLPEVCLAACNPHDVPLLELALSTHEVQSIRVTPLSDGFTWYLPPELAVLVRLTFPYHLLLPLGWRAHCPGQPVPTSAADARAADSILIVKPKVPAPVMPLSELQHLMCVWLLRAQLCALAESHPAPDCPVEVQLLHQHIWFGSLPGDFCLQALADMWQAAAIAVQLPPACRIYSGPFAKDPATRLADLHLCPARVFHSRIHAQPVLTVHTEIHGGGQKTETKEWARSQLAATCLSRGIELSHTTEFVEKLVAQTNPRNLSRALHQKQAAEQWEAVERLAQDLGLPLPEPSLSNPRTEARLQKAVAARKLNKQHDIKVEDVEIRSGFFKNADSSPATVLAALKPGACGVFLTSVDQAVEVLETLSGVRPDELCVVVLGHCCPQHSTCSGPIVFPAVSRQSGHSMLLAGCYHNVGGTPIQPGLESDGVLPMPKVALCAFEAHAAEFEDEVWSRLCGAPVRAALDLFADGGVPHAFTMPWGRRHLCRGRACPPAQADWVGFQAKVDDASLCAVLEVSGHNGIYCTPRDHERVLSKSFAIIWLGPDKSSCVKASLQVVEQKGLAYARGRYGLRVPAEHFERAHRQLKPGADVPSRLAVTQVYRVGPIPQSAGAAELKQWSDKIKWPVKILRASGPTRKGQPALYIRPVSI